MLDIEKVDHIGIRISDKAVSCNFYERLGFRTLSDTGFEKGHPIIMQHPSGVVLNLLGPADMPNDRNILMDVDEKYPGITHVSFKITSIDAAKRFLAEHDIALSGEFSFKDLQAVSPTRGSPRARARSRDGSRPSRPRPSSACLRAAPGESSGYRPRVSFRFRSVRRPSPVRYCTRNERRPDGLMRTPKSGSSSSQTM